MDITFEQKVRERAYELWVAAGMEDGMAEEHWFIAQQAVVTEAAEPKLGRAKKAKAPAKSKSAPKSKVKKTPLLAN